MLICVLLTAAFLLGGGSRGDIASLIFLRPLSAVLLGLGVITLRLDHVRSHRFLFMMAFLITAYLVLQLVPLPPAVWHELPGRELLRDIDAAAALTDTWRPMTLDPPATRNALFSMMVPLSALVLGVQLSAEEHSRLVPVLLVLGGLSAVLGLVQMLSDPQGPLYFYRITNNGAPVGLLANRNHQALLLGMMLPLLAFGSRQKESGRLTLPFAALIGLALLPLILVAGSRAGMLLAALSICTLPLVVGTTTKAKRAATSRAIPSSFRLLNGASVWIFSVLLGLGLVGLTILFGRGLAWERFGETRIEDEARGAIIPTVIDMIASYFPVGTGAGTFERVFRVHEPDALLSPIYMQQAHNDWLDIPLTGGIFALALLGVAVCAFTLRLITSIRQRSKETECSSLSHLGLILIGLIGLASLVDYPLRVPALACLFAVAAIWACGWQSNTKSSLTEDTLHRKRSST